jgi:Glycosyltransferase family 87
VRPNWTTVGAIAGGALLLLVSLIAVATCLIQEWQLGQVAPDFSLGLYPQLRGLLFHGVPFDPPGTLMTGENRVYTVFTALLLSPLGLLPLAVAQVVMTIMTFASFAGALVILGVRDYRIFAAVALWPPVLACVQSENVTALLVLVAAIAWRYRDRDIHAGVAVGVAAAMKVFMWPLGLWLLARRRMEASAVAAAVVALSFLMIVPFGNPIDYFKTAQANARAVGVHAYTVYVLLGATTQARIAWLAVAAVAAVIVFMTRSEDLRFAAAIAACVLFSPIVWLHYFALLLVPLAAQRPRFGALWLFPLIYWLVPMTSPQPWQIIVALLAMAFITIAPSLADRQRLRGSPATASISPLQDAEVLL